MNRRTMLFKSLTWRLISSATSIVLAWLWFGDLKAATAFAGIESMVKFAEYYLHELSWQYKIDK